MCIPLIILLVSYDASIEDKLVGWSDKSHESHRLKNGFPILWLRISSPVKLGRITYYGLVTVYEVPVLVDFLVSQYG